MRKHLEQEKDNSNDMSKLSSKNSLKLDLEESDIQYCDDDQKMPSIDLNDQSPKPKTDEIN